MIELQNVCKRYRVKNCWHTVLEEALQKPPLPSRMEQKCSVRLFLTTPECAVFLAIQ